MPAGTPASTFWTRRGGWTLDRLYADGVHPNGAGNVKVAVRLAPLLQTAADTENPGRHGRRSRRTRPDWHGPLQNAYLRGERRLVITPGTYLLTNKGEAQIPLRHWRDAVLSAYMASR